MYQSLLRRNLDRLQNIKQCERRIKAKETKLMKNNGLEWCERTCTKESLQTWPMKFILGGNPSSSKKTQVNLVRTKASKRLVWTKELHKHFLQVVNELGEENGFSLHLRKRRIWSFLTSDTTTAKPKEIAERMNIEGITLKNISSHLQKYRLRKVKGYVARKRTTSTVIEEQFQIELSRDSLFLSFFTSCNKIRRQTSNFTS